MMGMGDDVEREVGLKGSVGESIYMGGIVSGEHEW